MRIDTDTSEMSHAGVCYCEYDDNEGGFIIVKSVSSTFGKTMMNCREMFWGSKSQSVI